MIDKLILLPNKTRSIRLTKTKLKKTKLLKESFII